MKLWCIGIRGKALNFIRSLYLNSRVAIRVGKDLSEIFILEKGLCQGCPISLILFDIFINDILQGFEEFSVKIPGVKGHKLCGLMFTNDIVVLAPDKSKL